MHYGANMSPAALFDKAQCKRDAPTRFDYGMPRFTSVGVLDGRMVVIVWTPRGEARRIISMKKANEREIEKFASALD